MPMERVVSRESLSRESVENSFQVSEIPFSLYSYHSVKLAIPINPQILTLFNSVIDPVLSNSIKFLFIQSKFCFFLCNMNLQQTINYPALLFQPVY